MSATTQKNSANMSSAPPVLVTSDQVCQPIGSMNIRSSSTKSGGIRNAKISLNTNSPIPFTGSVRSCLTAHPA